MANFNIEALYIKTPRIFFGVLIFFMLLGITYCVGDLLFNHNEANIFLICNLLTSLPFFVYYYRIKRIFLYNPINFIFPSILLGTTLRGIYVYLGMGNNWYVDNFLLLGKDYTVLFSGSVINLVGAWLALFGFLLIKDKQIHIKNPNKILVSSIWSQRNFKVLIGILVSISLVAFALYLRKINFSFDVISQKRYSVVQDGDEEAFASFGYLTLFIKLGEVALHLFAIWYFVNIKKFKLSAFLVFIGLFLVAHIPNFVDSSRSAIIYSFTFIMVVRLVLIKGRIEIKKILPFFGVIILILTVMGTLREISNYKEEDTAGKLTEGLSPVVILEKVVGNRNMMGLTKSSHIYEAFQRGDYSYYGGTTLFTWIFSPIPRSIWVNKPQTSIGLDIKNIFGSSDEVARGGVPPGLPTEFFMNFGILGISLMLIYGMFLKWLYNFMRSYCNINTLILYYLMLINLGFNLIGSNVSKSMFALILDVAPLLIILSFVVIAIPKTRQA